jgi:hypothetical protein
VPAPPTNAPAPAGAIDQRPTQPTPTPLPIGGAVPAGWQVYQGPARMPFTIAYPPGWKVDDSKVTEVDRRVFFRSPDDPEKTYLMIGLLGLLNYSSGDGDELRNSLFRYEIDSLAGSNGLCGKKEIEVTRDNRFAGLTFKSVGATCQHGSGLHYVYAGVGVGDDPKLWYAPWRFAAVAPYGNYQRDADQLYLPMLNSLTVVPQTKAK